MRVLVCGGRNFGLVEKEHDFIIRILETEFCPTPTEDTETWLPPRDLVIISGAAKGVDTIAIDWAVVNFTQCEEYPADWDKYGKAAGIIRNKQMLEKGKPDLVIAFPGGKGTHNMVELAKKEGIPVKEFEYVD